MTKEQLFKSLLVREKHIAEGAELFDMNAELLLSEKGIPTIEGQFCIANGENYTTLEFIFYNNKWRTPEQFEEIRIERSIKQVKVSEKAEVVKNELSDDLRAFYETLPDDPNQITKGSKRDKLKLLPRELLIKKYPVSQFAFLYKWLNEENNEKQSE